MSRDPTLFGHRTVTEAAVATFGSLTGDYSRIHFDRHLGAASPHGRGFAHGLLSASWALGALALHAPERLGCGEPGATVTRFEVRYHDVVRFGDTLAVQCDGASEPGSVPGWDARRAEFAMLDQAARTVTTGTVVTQVRQPDGSEHPSSASGSAEPAWPRDRVPPPAALTAMTAEDVLEHGPRGASPVRTLTETDVVNFANFSGELNPLYLDAVFAERALFGERIAPPMLCFCLGFSAWLRELLRLPLTGGESSAGHLGDRWQWVAPVFIGDTLEVRYRPLSLRRTRSDPARGVATFGLQLVNQHEAVVQQAEVDMMLAMSEPGSVD